MSALYGGIEAGGTKFICAIGTGPNDIRSEKIIQTTTPDETISHVITFFQKQLEMHDIAALGIGSFGPLDADPYSPTYGSITSTPKKGWVNTDFVGTIHQVLDLPIGFDTDVNVAALGERMWGAAKGLDNFIYLTVGTGIGGGGLVNGQSIRGMMHPEMGHIRIPHDLKKDSFKGICPYHVDCLEGLASGPAIEKRWGTPPEELPSDHKAWELEADYLALAIVNYITITSPKCVIIGGGVMNQQQLFPMIRERVKELLNNYIQTTEVIDHIDTYITPPALGERSGILGAIALARKMVDS